MEFQCFANHHMLTQHPTFFLKHGSKLEFVIYGNQGSHRVFEESSKQSFWQIIVPFEGLLHSVIS